MFILRMILGNLEIWQWILLLAVLVPMSIKDIKTKEIDLYVSLLFVLVALSIRVCYLNERDIVLLLDMVPGFILTLAAFITKEKIGFGDSVAMIFIGSVVGYKAALIVLLVSLFLSGILSTVLLIIKKVKKDTEIPFVPFLSLGVLAGGIL